MELRHLRYFLAVAEQLNFTRAAERLHVAQPPLTRQIKALELELGVTLVDRSAYRIKLTAAGLVFAAEARRILGDVRLAIVAARKAERRVAGCLRVGFTESATFNPAVRGSLRSFRARCPHIELALEEHPSEELSQAVREGRLDIAFLRPPLASYEGLALMSLQPEEMVMALPGDDPLCGRRNVPLGELRHRDLILYPRAAGPGLTDAVLSACEAAGFRPRVRQFAPHLSAAINLVSASLGVSIVPKSMKGMQRPAVAYRRIAGQPLHAPLAIAHRHGDRSGNVLQFVETLDNLARLDVSR